MPFMLERASTLEFLGRHASDKGSIPVYSDGPDTGKFAAVPFGGSIEHLQPFAPRASFPQPPISLTNVSRTAADRIRASRLALVFLCACLGARAWGAIAVGTPVTQALEELERSGL